MRKQRGETVAGTNFPRIQKGSLLSSLFSPPSFNFGLTLTNPLLCISPSSVWSVNRPTLCFPPSWISAGENVYFVKNLFTRREGYLMSKVAPFRNGRKRFFFWPFPDITHPLQKNMYRAIGVIGDWEWCFEWGGNVPSGPEVCPVESGLANTKFEKTKISVISQFCCCFRNIFPWWPMFLY